MALHGFGSVSVVNQEGSGSKWVEYYWMCSGPTRSDTSVSDMAMFAGAISGVGRSVYEEETLDRSSMRTRRGGYDLERV